MYVAATKDEGTQQMGVFQQPVKRAGIGRMDKMRLGVIIECKHDLEGA